MKEKFAKSGLSFCLCLSGLTFLVALVQPLLAVLIFFSGMAFGCYYYCVAGGSSSALDDSILVIGITGTRASGKSFAGEVALEEKIDVIDTDHIVHRLLREDANVKQAIRLRFGNSVFDASGAVDRKALGKIIFADTNAKRDLERIVHPATTQDCQKQIKALAAQGKTRVVVLVPLLFEARLEDQYHVILTVTVDEAVLRERLKKRDKVTDAEAEQLLAAQMPQSEKARRAHYVLDNSGSKEEFRQKMRQFFAQLEAAKH